MERVLHLVTASERGDLADQALALDAVWQPFMLKDPYSAMLVRSILSLLDWTFFLIDDAAPDDLLGRALTVPIEWKQPLDELPDRGWDAAIELGLECTANRLTPSAICALEITLDPKATGRGLSRICLSELRRIGIERGLTHLFAPVRPTTKTDHQHEPMEAFIRRETASGDLADPWLRTHAQLGAEIIKVARLSMVISGTFEQWREWTGLDLAACGASVEVPGGLTPLLINQTERTAAYIEPNVWMSHRLAAP